MALTLAEAQELRDAYKAAMLALATGKEYQIGQRKLTRADERFVADQFEKYDAMVDSLDPASTTTGSNRITRIVPRDL